ncbi:MAG: hypothetical protein A2X05_17970 [Bacteroidetes bacterium GWE2_41_25]|nr:MAG: hypothetical protein A2X03_03750 [Bacteroidetes bacterium GWA2_40_15]OFX92660.1 MAG: hypothetical protein A2X06_12920 [Bacteroidetes bacterium GWC2_40_22]OFX94184.1 MAG: hypothetical protein A2X05_17970 [Bacteroidetes bacterium GWE2_41_25]HBH85290.1 hypothetical protein [Bacteroidales bacterium]HBQ84385.1 hypothetical protein [Bacteroidales bacterium]
MNKLKLLTKEEIHAIHDTSIRILAEIGIQVPSQDAMKALADAGADVDFAHERAKLPENLVMDSLSCAGKQFILYGRDPSRSIRFGYGDFNLPSTEGQAFIIEEDGRNRRPGTCRDVQQAIIIGDALENVDWMGGFVLPDEIPASVRDVYLAGELIKGSTKPQHVLFNNVHSFRYIREICEATAGGKEKHRQHPLLSAFIEPISPLRFAKDGLEILKECVMGGLPVYFGPMVQSGATGPVTLAGTAALENAEILSAIVIAQAFQRGIPVGYGCSCHTMDLMTMMISFGAAEQSLFAIAMTQLAQFYGLPSLFNAGLSDSKRHDAQSGMERGMSMLTGALAGLETFAPIGIVGADQGASMTQLIIDNEMAGYVKRLLRGFKVDRETLAFDVIQRVGIGGNFLTDDHTLEHYLNELWMPRGFDRQNWDRWISSGRRSMYEWALERKEQILSSHQPEAVDTALAVEIDKIVNAARKELS